MSIDEMQSVGWTWAGQYERNYSFESPREYLGDSYTDYEIKMGYMTEPERIYTETEVKKALEHKDRVIDKLAREVNKVGGTCPADIYATEFSWTCNSDCSPDEEQERACWRRWAEQKAEKT